MRAAIGWLEREAIRVDRGSHNTAWLARHADHLQPGQTPRQLDTSGVVAASFRHRTSRAGDPLLHWHVLVANLVEGADGRWSAFVHPEVFRNKMAASDIFQTVFRDELTERLGVEWRPGRHVPEIAGIPQGLLDQFSKRSAQIDAWLAATGTPDTPEGRQQAVLATRRHKPEVEHERFDVAWKQEAIDHGWGPDHAEALLSETIARADTAVGDDDFEHRDDYDEVWRLDTYLPGPNGTTEHVERLVDPEEWIATCSAAASRPSRRRSPSPTSSVPSPAVKVPVRRSRRSNESPTGYSPRHRFLPSQPHKASPNGGPARSSPTSSNGSSTPSTPPRHLRPLHRQGSTRRSLPDRRSVTTRSLRSGRCADRLRR